MLLILLFTVYCFQNNFFHFIFLTFFVGYPPSQNDVEVAEDCFQVSILVFILIMQLFFEENVPVILYSLFIVSEKAFSLFTQALTSQTEDI